MANDPYAGLAKPIKETPRRDPYAGLGRELTPTKKKIPERSLLEAGVEAFGNIPASAVQYAKGLYEAVTSPVETAGTLLDIMAGGAYKVLPKPVQDFVVSLEDDPAALNRAIGAANQFGGQMKQRYGSYNAIKNTLATDPVGFAADFSTVFSGGAGAAAGVGKVGRFGQQAARRQAMLGDVGQAGVSRVSRNVARKAEAMSETLRNAARVTDPINAFAPAGRGVRKIAERAPLKIANFMSPKSAMYMDIAEGRGNELVQQLRAPGEIVPGSVPTAAQQASPLGLTQFSAVGESAAKADPSTYYAIGNAQDAARQRALQGVGGTPEDLAALREGRTRTGRALYGNVQNNVVPIDDTFRALTQRPSMDKAMRRAEEISAEQGVPFQIGPDILPGTMAGMPTAGRPAQYTVQSLHNLKTALDDIIKDPATFGVGANEARLMGRTRDQLIKWIESKEPGYKAARETFATQSRRINQAEVGQFLENKLTSPLTDEASRAAVFANAMRDAPTTVKRATTGAPRYQNLEDLLEPHQLAAVESVRRDLAREQITKTQAREGATAAPRVGQLASQAGDMPQFLNRVATIANAIYNRVQGKIDRKLAMEIAYEMATPERAAGAIEKAMVREELARATGRGAAAAATQVGKVLQSTPAKVGGQFQNIMTQAENQNAMAMAQYPKFDAEGRPLISVERALDLEGNVYTFPVYGVVPSRKR